METASDLLRKEHELILIALDILETASGRLTRGEKVDWEELSGLSVFLQVFADRWHHGKEEGIYFPAIEAAGIPRHGGPIGVMFAEHDIGRALMSRLREASAAGDRDGLAGAAAEYVELMRPHIEKENLMLYMMGDSRLSEREHARIVGEYARYESASPDAANIPELKMLPEKIRPQYQ